VPRLSQQLPVLAVVAGAVTVEDVVVAAVVVVEATAVVVVVDEVDELQDAKIMEVAMRTVIKPHRIPFFTCSFFFILRFPDYLFGTYLQDAFTGLFDSPTGSHINPENRCVIKEKQL
jgi:hypothetical protein